MPLEKYIQDLYREDMPGWVGKAGKWAAAAAVSLPLVFGSFVDGKHERHSGSGKSSPGIYFAVPEAEAAPGYLSVSWCPSPTPDKLSYYHVRATLISQTSNPNAVRQADVQIPLDRTRYNFIGVEAGCAYKIELWGVVDKKDGSAITEYKSRNSPEAIALLYGNVSAYDRVDGIDVDFFGRVSRGDAPGNTPIEKTDSRQKCDPNGNRIPADSIDKNALSSNFGKMQPLPQPNPWLWGTGVYVRCDPSDNCPEPTNVNCYSTTY